MRLFTHSTRSERRARLARAALGVAVGGIGVLMSTVIPARGAYAAVGICPPGEVESPTNSPVEIFTDNNVAVFSGGDMRVRDGRAELEGLVVATGDFVNERPSGRLNLGWVGVGSGVVPTPGAPMLRVGGSLSADGIVLDVGAHGMSPSNNTLGGSIEVGGSVSPEYPSSAFELNGGTLRSGIGVEALGDYADYTPKLREASDHYASETATGTVEPGLRFIGTGAPREVFEVTADQLGSTGEVHFEGIADGATVIVNVTGGPVNWAPNYLADNGVRVDGAGAGFGRVAQRTL